MKRRKGICFLIFILCLFLSACGKDGMDKSGIRVFYLGKVDHDIREQNYMPEANDREGIIEELIGKLCIQPKEMTLIAPISSFRLLTSETKGSVITLNFSSNYYDMDAIDEVLTRTAIVNTLCSFSQIDGVCFLVDGEALHDADGVQPGIMEPDQFIYNSYTEMRNYERVRLHLYFADKSGKRLVDAFRTVVYNSNMPLERIVLEQVIQGPNASFAYPTVNKDTRVINITTRDGICYVNLSGDFANGRQEVTPQAAIYSIVNSLCELSNIDAVQISVDGQQDTVFMETISLTGSFRMDPDIIEGVPESGDNDGG